MTPVNNFCCDWCFKAHRHSVRIKNTYSASVSSLSVARWIADLPVDLQVSKLVYNTISTSLLEFENENDYQQCGMCDQQMLRSACTYGQSDQSLCKSLEYSMTVKLLTEQHLELLRLKGGCTGSYESSLQNATLLEITCHGSFAVVFFF